MNITTLRRAALTLVMAGIGATAYCQDLIARQAPVDRRLRAVDSVAIQRAVDRDLELDLSSDVYNTWVKVLTLKFALATPLLPLSMAKCALYVTTLEDMATT